MMTVLSAMTPDIDATALATLLQRKDPLRKTVIVDCRSFIDYNVLHIRHAINAFYSKMMRRRVYDNKVCSSVMLSQIGEETCGSALVDLVLYSESEVGAKTANCNYSTVLARMKRKCCSGANSMDDSPQKLLRTLQEKFTSSKRFHEVLVLRDGFNDFHSRFPELCESFTERRGNMEKEVESHIRTSVSHPCLSNANDGPTQILPFLYLGSQQDAMDSKVLSQYGIKYVINLSVNCPQPDALKQEGHFMRIPVNDTYQEKLLPHFEDAFKFLDEVCERGSVALVHCLAGISRSPTLAIAYMMRRNKWTSEQAYKYVKERRPSISPNFNFMGQLLEYESRLREQHCLSSTSESNDIATSPTSFTLSTLSSSEPANDSRPIRENDSGNTLKLGKSISCETISQGVSIRPQNFWDSDCSEPSSKTNENGKRAMEFASLHSLDRPRILDGLKSRKALSIPQKVDEDLPSPSTELQKLSFGHSPDASNSASNPLFGSVSTESLSSAALDPTKPSTSTEEQYQQQRHFSAENPTFDSRDHSPIALSLPSSIVSRNSLRVSTGHKLLTRLSHCLRKGSCPVEHGSSKSVMATPPMADIVAPYPSTSSPCVIKNSSVTTEVVIRSQSVSALDKSQKRETATTGTSFSRRKKHEHRQKHRHFRSSTTATSGSSTSFREPDRDSISSASSLEILVQ